ncbi:MAG: response regulator [Pseudomonadota bacterium]|nr:response regulator [Pseudomonadota bacterium]
MPHQRTVYLVDDDAALRRSLSSQLSDLGLEAWPFSSGAEFVGMIGHLRPSLILLDMEMPHMAGLEVLAELVRREVDWPAIALSSRGDLGVAVEAMKLGAIDFLQKPLKRDLLEAALEFGWEVLERSLVAALARQEALDKVARLTPREVDIALALLRGMANKCAAHELGISVRTVEMHRAHILEKLGVKSLAEAAVLMTQAGLTVTSSDEPNPRKRLALRYCSNRKTSGSALSSLSRGSGSAGASFRPPEGGSRREPRRLPPFLLHSTGPR